MMSARLRVKGSSLVKPAEPTPHHRLWLSDLDVVQPVTHAPLVYFYRPNNTHDFFSPELMKNALSRTLVHFYPLAGRLHQVESGRLELDCNETGVVFYEAESDAEIDDFGNFKPTPELRNLVPNVDYDTHICKWPLVLLQLTVFRCGGISLGLAVSHTVFDGMSATHFVSTWAKMVRTGSTDIDVKPIFDRTVFRARNPPVGPAFDHKEFQTPVRLLGREENDMEEERKKESTVEMFKLTGQQVNSIRQTANESCNGMSGPKYSRYEAVAAHVWRCTCKARDLHADQLTMLYFVVDGRKRLHPPLPVGFFGNVVFKALAVGLSGDLVSNHVSYAASRIREVVEKMKDEYLRSALEFLNGQKDLTPFRSGSHTLGCTQGRFYGCPNLTLTSWLGLPFYEADFGWGPPIHVGPAALGFEGKGYVVPTGEEDGSLIIALRLQTQHMKALKDLFYEGCFGFRNRTERIHPPIRRRSGL